MFRKLGVAISLTVLIGGGTSFAAGSGQWSRETRQVGNKVTIDVFHRNEPYALTGNRRTEARTSSGRWMRETRHIGNKVTVDVFTR